MLITHTPKITTDGDRSIGCRITTLRKARGISQTALGQALGVSFQQVQKYEKGRNRVGAGRLQIIADHLGVPVSTFYDDPIEVNADRGTLQDLFQDPEVLDLVRAFTGITDKTTRSSVLSIVKAAAKLQRGSIAATD